MNRRRLAFLAVAAVFVLLFGGRWVALRYTESLWFQELGEGDRWRWLFLRSLLWQAIVFAATLAWFGAHSLGVYASIGSVHLPRRLGNLEIDEAVPRRTLRAIALAIAAILALATTYSFADLDDYIALARHAVPYGFTEPVLHRDAAFYMAVLPLLEVLHLLLAVSTLLATVLVVGLYALTGSLTVSSRRVRITPHARAHLIVLLCALALMVAWGFQLDALQLVAGGGHASGALTPSDKAIRIPASNALAMIALAVAAGSALAVRWVRPTLLFILWATLGVAAILGRFVVPVMTEAWGAAADPALVQNIAQLTDGYSRAAFGVTDVPQRPLQPGEVRAESAAALAEAVDGLYAWSGERGVPERLLAGAVPDSGVRRLWSVSPIEARDAEGRPFPAALAISQVDLVEALREVPRPRWATLHRGPAAWGAEPLAVAARLEGGELHFMSSLEPADSVPAGTPLRRAAGRIRFLPYGTDLAVVGPDESTAGDPAPGVLLRGMTRRMLLAWALQSPPLLDDHTSPADRVLYWRDIPSRLSRLYPFAAFDAARAALVDGRLVWLVDGYLMSARFPLAETVRWRGEDIDYLSASYLVTVDAVSGRTRFYLRRYASAFAASVARAEALAPLPGDSIPPAVRAAMRYPAALLGAQAVVLARRVERDSRGPTWQPAWQDTAVAAQDAAQLTPAQATLAIGERHVRRWQVLPINDVRGDRLGALVAGTVHGDGQTVLTLLRLNGAAPTTQAAALRIGAAPTLAAAAAGIQGAPRRGPILVVPAAGSVLYAQALMSSARTGGPLHMEGVALLAGGKVGFGIEPRGAARALVRGDTQNVLSLLGTGELSEARAAFLALDSARQAGDWERFGRAWANLRRALRLDPATGSPPGPRP